MATLGYNLYRLRKELELTQKEMAKKAGLSRGYYNAVENNNKSISVETLIYVARSLNVPISRIINDETHVTRDVYNKKEMRKETV